MIHKHKDQSIVTYLIKRVQNLYYIVEIKKVQHNWSNYTNLELLFDFSSSKEWLTIHNSFNEGHSLFQKTDLVHHQQISYFNSRPINLQKCSNNKDLYCAWLCNYMQGKDNCQNGILWAYWALSPRWKGWTDTLIQW